MHSPRSQSKSCYHTRILSLLYTIKSDKYQTKIQVEAVSFFSVHLGAVPANPHPKIWDQKLCNFYSSFRTCLWVYLNFYWGSSLILTSSPCPISSSFCPQFCETTFCFCFFREFYSFWEEGWFRWQVMGTSGFVHGFAWEMCREILLRWICRRLRCTWANSRRPKT